MIGYFRYSAVSPLRLLICIDLTEANLNLKRIQKEPFFLKRGSKASLKKRLSKLKLMFVSCVMTIRRLWELASLAVETEFEI